MKVGRFREVLVVLVVAGSIVGRARVASADPGDPANVDRPKADDEPARAIDRTWLYTDDARVAAPLTVVAMTNVSYTHEGSSPTRADSPFPNAYSGLGQNTAQPGGMVSVGGEVGLLPRVSVMALGQMGFGADGAGASAGAIAGLRVQLLPSEWTRTHLVASAGYLREAWAGPVSDDAGKWFPGQPHGDNGAWIQASFSGDVARFRFASTVHGEHIFTQGRDGLDVMVQLGASYRVAGGLRAGVEYVGQDLEEIADRAADGGARHFVGPIVSMQLLSNRLTLVAGPSFGLSELSPRLLGRFALAYGF